MKISKIEPQKRHRNRSSVFLNGNYRFSITNDLVIKFNLNEGDEISEELVKNILREAEKEKIKERAFKILRYRNRSVQEMRERLFCLGYEEALVGEVINDLVTDGTLNDTKFAQAFVNDYTKLNPRGNKFILQELRKKGISHELSTAILSQRNEKEVVKKLLATKLSIFNKENLKERAKIIRRLLSRGFTPNVVYEILDERDE